MKYKYIKRLFSQLKRYHLTEFIGKNDAIYNWASTLTTKQIQNFLNLDIEFERIKFPLTILIDKNLLSCSDYHKRIEALSKLGNCQDNILLQKDLCSHIFLSSSTYYSDIEALSKYGIPNISLSFLANETFIKSKYHDEDLKLILTAKDKSNNKIDFIIASALVDIACDKNSIRSPYHQFDMNVVYNCDSTCLQLNNSDDKYSANHLAINKLSLSDKFHINNMKLLTVNPVANQLLFKLMTDYKIVKDKKYRVKVGIIATAKSKQVAIAMYTFIKCLSEDQIKKFKIDNNFLVNKELQELLMNTVECDNDEDFEELAYSINYVSDNCALDYALLLKNPFFRKSQYKNFDLQILQKINNDETFKVLVRYLHKQEIHLSPNHIEDLFNVSKVENPGIRKLLLEMSSNFNSILSNTHCADMKFIFELENYQLTEDVLKVLSYYMLNPKGISNINRDRILQNIKKYIESNQLKEINLYLSDTVEKKENSFFNTTNTNFALRCKPLCLVKTLFKKI